MLERLSRYLPIFQARLVTFPISMAVLRSGKITRSNKRTITKSKAKKMFLQFGIKDCVVKIDRLTGDQTQKMKKCQRYALRSRKNIDSTPPLTLIPVIEKKISILSKTSIIWNELTNREYVLLPGAIVLAKMNKFRPWPARINTIYRVGGTLKCFVLFYGTFQIGSVLTKECDSYLLHAVNEIKAKYKWKINYDEIAESSEDERIQKVVKLTQIQRFFLALRDIEKLHGIPYERSMIRGDTI